MKRQRAPFVTVKLVSVLTVGLTLLLITPLYAFGPYVHRSAMEKAHKALLAEHPDVPVLWTVGNPWDNIEADLNGPSHGANVDLGAGLLNSNLPDLIESQFMEMKTGFMHYLDGQRSVSLSKPIRRLCHYIADGMAIGQISGPALWGWKDDLIDFAAEGVSDKQRWRSDVTDWGEGHLAEGLDEFKEAVLETYAIYREDADRWFRRFPWFPTSRGVTHMTRRGVSQAGSLASSFILLAWRDATNDYYQLTNPGFEDGLDFWRAYGDGLAEAATQYAYSGSHSAHIQPDEATGHYFGLYQKDIAVEPGTEYRLSLWVKTNATSGRAAAALGVWSSDPTLNHHTDFGHIGGKSDWTHISGTWKSRPDEDVIRVMLYGTPDFVGEAWFDDLVIEEIEPEHATFEKGVEEWDQ